jgi:hypothetical protein
MKSVETCENKRSERFPDEHPTPHIADPLESARYSGGASTVLIVSRLMAIAWPGQAQNIADSSSRFG